MPKARKRTGRSQTIARSGKATTVQSRTSGTGRSATATTTHREPSSQVSEGSSRRPNIASANRPFASSGVRGPQSLIMPGMVALGCWLMAFTLFFLSTDPNRNLFGGMAVLMAALWTFSFGTRARKLLLLRQRS
ncbi:MAG TPA: hypothetical protein VJ761_22590 [Ktedonobacteraceae bacterium]|nr:hypothetical protein [Ktedonobacteraceae bacterium]